MIVASSSSSSSSATVAVYKATSDLLISPDWTVNIDICDSVNSHRQAKYVVKAVKRRLQHKSSKVQFLTLTLLETMVKNCGDYVHVQIAERNILGEMVKIVRKKASTEGCNTSGFESNHEADREKKGGEEKRMTQEEMLLEAAQTEIMNLRNLERVLAREEEVKKRAIVHKSVYTGPQVRYFSKDGCSYLEFSRGLSFQSEISTTTAPYPEKVVYAVTGLPAK